MIGHRREVERPLELHGARAVAVRVERRQRHRLAAREAVGLGRRGAHVEGVGVERERGVHVQVAEVDVAQRIVRGAGGARLDVGPQHRRARRADLLRDRRAFNAAAVDLELRRRGAERREETRVAVERDALAGDADGRRERSVHAVGGRERGADAELHRSPTCTSTPPEPDLGVATDAEAAEDVAAAGELERRERARALHDHVTVDAGVRTVRPARTVRLAASLQAGKLTGKPQAAARRR